MVYKAPMRALARSMFTLTLSLTLAVLISLVLLVVIDLDQPERGLIRVSQQSLERLRAGLAAGGE